jgi:hypothetical protein
MMHVRDADDADDGDATSRAAITRPTLSATLNSRDHLPSTTTHALTLHLFIGLVSRAEPIGSMPATPLLLFQRSSGSMSWGAAGVIPSDSELDKEQSPFDFTQTPHFY